MLFRRRQLLAGASKQGGLRNWKRERVYRSPQNERARFTRFRCHVKDSFADSRTVTPRVPATASCIAASIFVSICFFTAATIKSSLRLSSRPRAIRMAQVTVFQRARTVNTTLNTTSKGKVSTNRSESLHCCVSQVLRVLNAS